MKKSGAWDPVYALVRRIPRGRVMTYGQISDLLGRRLSARAIGWAMHACPDGVPWHRVVSAQGACSADRFTGTDRQETRLRGEGVRFSAARRIDLERYRWRPGERRRA